MKTTMKYMALLLLVALGGCVSYGGYPSDYYGYSNYGYPYYDSAYPYYGYPYYGAPYYGSSLYFGASGWDGHDGYRERERRDVGDHRGGEPVRGRGSIERGGMEQRGGSGAAIRGRD